MRPVIKQMLDKYQCKSLEDYTHALKEIIQAIALLALWRSKFFEKASFYGGTALRILHHLNRFSEDLDFSLLQEDKHFKLEKYNEAILTELKSFGLEAEIISKSKQIQSNIDSVVIKTNTKLQLLSISAGSDITNTVDRNQKVTIKMEVDIDPPLCFNTESQIILTPIPFEVNVFQLPDLFATKVHAVLCRKWQIRIKGRDWFDLIWYISHSIPLRLRHLEARLIKSGDWNKKTPLNEKDVINLLTTKIENTDFELAKKDVMPFIIDHRELELWSKTFFLLLIKKLIIAEI